MRRAIRVLACGILVALVVTGLLAAGNGHELTAGYWLALLVPAGLAVARRESRSCQPFVLRLLAHDIRVTDWDDDGRIRLDCSCRRVWHLPGLEPGESQDSAEARVVAFIRARRVDHALPAAAARRRKRLFAAASRPGA